MDIKRVEKGYKRDIKGLSAAKQTLKRTHKIEEIMGILDSKVNFINWASFEVTSFLRYFALARICSNVRL